MSKEQKTLLFISLIMVYTQGLWERIFSMQPGGASIFVELPIWLFLIVSFESFNKKTPARILFVVFIIFSNLASIVNGSGIIAWLKYIRYFVYFYLIFQSLWHIHVTPKQWASIFKLVIFLIIIQGVGSSFNLFVLNQRIEGHVGLMSSLGGTTAATFPLLVISLSVLVFLFSNKHSIKFYFLLIICIIGAIMVGYASSKRAIFFTIPSFLLILIYISYLQLKKDGRFYKKIVIIGLLLTSFIPVYIFGISTSHGLNYSLAGNETNQQVFEKAFSYVEEYENSTEQSGNTTGRYGTSTHLITNALHNISTFTFGNGYGSIKDESTKDELGVAYGIVGFTRDIVSAGWLVMLLTVLIISKIIVSNKSIRFKFTKTLRIALVLIFLFTHFTYSSDFTTHLKINFLLALICAFINSPVHAFSLYSAVSVLSLKRKARK